VALAALFTATWNRGGEVERLYTLYLTPNGTPSAGSRTKVVGPDADSFRDNPAAQAALQKLRSDLPALVIAATPPPLADPRAPTTVPVSRVIPNGGRIHIAYSGFDAAGLLAGGDTSGSVIGGVTVKDERDLLGNLQLVPEADATGVLRRVSLHFLNSTLEVLDGVDFCPGGVGGWFAQRVTIPMSRLEATPVGGGQAGFEATPVLFYADVPVPNIAPVDVTSAYDNDPDHDDRPNTQPWPLAGYTLDNCPEFANPDQVDSNGDGIGDACGQLEVTGATVAPVKVDHSAAVSITVRNIGQAPIIAPRTSAPDAPDCARGGPPVLPAGATYTMTCQTNPVSGSTNLYVAAQGYPDDNRDGQPDGFSVTASGTVTVTVDLVLHLVTGSAAPWKVALGSGTVTVHYTDGRSAQVPVSAQGWPEQDIDLGPCGSASQNNVNEISYAIQAQSLPSTAIVTGSIPVSTCAPSAAIRPEAQLHYIVIFTKKKDSIFNFSRVSFYVTPWSGNTFSVDQVGLDVGSSPALFDLGVCANVKQLVNEFVVAGGRTATSDPFDPDPTCSETFAIGL
jgi:hypothetical protein